MTTLRNEHITVIKCNGPHATHWWHRDAVVTLTVRGENEKDCRKQIREAKWRTHKNGRHSCALCVKDGTSVRTSRTGATEEKRNEN